MILSDTTLHAMLERFIPDHADHDLVNPASVDIRIGHTLLLEIGAQQWSRTNLLRGCNELNPYMIMPKAFALVDTYERIVVPNGYAIELKLKSSRAREGYNHSLAFWVDPGWDGILTMEVQNVTRFTNLPFWTGMRFAQIIVHQLDQPAATPYAGRYNKALMVERSKA